MGANDNFIEITDAKVSKGITKKLFATLINNSKVKTIHIGDSMNDSTAVGQLDEVILMKNGSEEFKKLANIVSEFNNKDGGIINTFKKYCF
ncbi:HAD hydrolase family protein [Mycoplasmoides gallisepticum]|nr:HAD hydrolase family protein [Mycoplasmoides gallisepticum]